MQLGEMIIAGAVLFLCAVMLLRLALGSTRRERFDRTILNAWQRYPLRAWESLRRQQAQRRQADLDRARRESDARLRTEAEEQARTLIARARDQAHGRVPPPGSSSPAVERDGNVIRPQAFRKPEPGATHPGSDTRH